MLIIVNQTAPFPYTCTFILYQPSFIYKYQNMKEHTSLYFHAYKRGVLLTAVCLYATIF